MIEIGVDLRLNQYDRESVRAYYLARIESARRGKEARDFCTWDFDEQVSWYEWRLRWLDCAPDGAHFTTAPLQGKSGIPLDGNHDCENVGPNKAVREARIRHGVHPLMGISREPWAQEVLDRYYGS